MIDFHTHILPAVDDGAGNINEALALAEVLIKEGVEAAVCTPHFYPSQTPLEDFILRRNKAIKELGQVNIKLIPASETFLHGYLFHYSDLGALCIENTDYMLIELPFSSKWDDDIYTMIGNLTLYYNIIPIVAHIERYPAVKRSSRCIKKLKDYGCLMQLNTSSLLDTRLSKDAVKYIRKGFIDLLGSDCHNMTSRLPVIKDAIRKIDESTGPEYYRSFEQNAVKILNNIDIRN